MGIGNRLMKRLSGKKNNDKPSAKKDVRSDNSSAEIPAPPSDYKYNFEYLNDLMNSGQDEIKLEHDIILGKGEESKFPHGITVFQNIDGNGHSIDARGKTRIFVNGFFFRGECIVKNLTLKNGFVKDNGVGHGAAFENSSYHMTFINCTFENNCADSGGAVFNEGKLNLIDCTFIENSADIGGAIHNNYNAELNLKGCTFIRNIANLIGDVIVNDGESDMTIDGCTFKKNISKNGMIFNPKGNLKIFNSEFCKNDSWENSFLVLNNSFLAVESSVFKRNTVNVIISNTTRAMSISHGKFYENVVQSSIYNSGQSCDITNSIFKDNIATEEDSAASMFNETDLTLKNITISYDEKSILNDGNILIQDNKMDIEGAIKNNGRIVYASQDRANSFEELESLITERKSFTITLKEDFSLHASERYFYEGGIELDMDGLVIDGKGHTIDGGDKSRIFFITGKNITLKNIVFKKGHTFENFEKSRNTNGGALRIYPNSSLKIENCQFIDNVSERHGGAIFNQGELKLSDSSFTKNYLKPYIGGVMWFSGCALYNDGKLTVEDTNFKGNYIVDNMDYDIFSPYTSDVVMSEGAGISNGKNGHAHIIGTTFEENNAGHGGAILNRGTMVIVKSFIIKNMANDGAAIRNVDSTLSIRDSVIKDNISGYDNLDTETSDIEGDVEIINCEIE